MRSAGKTTIRGAKPSKSKHRKRGAVHDDLESLFDIGRFERNEITLAEINKLRNVIDCEGMPTAVAEIGLSDTTLLRVCAGFAHQLQSSTRKVIREWLRG